MRRVVPAAGLACGLRGGAGLAPVAGLVLAGLVLAGLVLAGLVGVMLMPRWGCSGLRRLGARRLGLGWVGVYLAGVCCLVGGVPVRVVCGSAW